MRLLFLGTGTSVGVPIIGCECPVCVSVDPKNKRRRASLYIEAAGLRLLVDTPPDFREQALQYKLKRIDAVFFTHSHADHIFGFDDIRRYNTIQQSVIPAYGTPGTIADLKRVFDYVEEGSEPHGLFRPRIEFREIVAPIEFSGITITPLPVEHATKPTIGFLFQAEGHAAAYIPDCVRMTDKIVEKLKAAKLDVMILDALRHKPHKTHICVDDSVALLKRIGARQSYLIHMCHDLDHETTEKYVNADPTIHLSYDGLAIEVG